MKLKTIILASLGFAAFSASAVAQTPKFGHFDTEAFMQLMPETKEVEKTMDAEQGKVETQLAVLMEEFKKMYQDYQQKAPSMSEKDRIAKEEELQERQQRVMTFRQTAMQDLQKKNQELFQPIALKVRKAIQEVGAQEGYVYIFEEKSPLIVHTGIQSEDITPLMKKKLGIK